MTGASLIGWLTHEAECLDSSTSKAELVLANIAGTGMLKAGVPSAMGGTEGPFSTAISAIADLAEHSLTAAFVCWAQRAVIESLIQSPNQGLAQQWLPALLNGTLAGTPGLSNAMKALSGIGEMQLQAQRRPDGVMLNGSVPWATNAHKQGFLLAVAAYDSEANTYSVFAVPHHADGVKVGGDQNLLALVGSNTVSLHLENTILEDGWQIHPNAKIFLPELRPAFLGLQSGMAFGLARASVRAARSNASASHVLLHNELDTLEAELHNYWSQLCRIVDVPAAAETLRGMVEVRIGAVELALRAVQLELQALGGRAYLVDQNKGFARRWREAAFLPIITPSLMHLKAEMARQGT